MGKLKVNGDIEVNKLFGSDAANGLIIESKSSAGQDWGEGVYIVPHNNGYATLTLGPTDRASACAIVYHKDTKTHYLEVRSTNTATYQSYIPYATGTLLNSGNYTDYTVTKTGTGASGTWGINVTGSAGSVAWGNVTGKPSTFTPSSHSHSYLASRGNVTAESGTNWPAQSGLSMSNVYNNGYPTTYGNLLTMYGIGCSQLLIGWSGSSGANAPAYIRSKRDTTDANWSSWQQLATTDGSVNYATSAGSVAWSGITNKPSTFTPSDHTHSYLPLSGGTMSGRISFSSHTWTSAPDVDNAVLNFGYAINSITSSTHYSPWFGGAHGISSQGYYATAVAGMYHTNAAHRGGFYIGMSWDMNAADTYYYFARDGHFITNKLVISSNYGSTFPTDVYVGEIFFLI